MSELPEFLAPIASQGLSDEYLSAPVLKQQNSLANMAKQLVDLDRQRGEQLRVPGEDAGDDAWKSLADKLNGKGALKNGHVQSAFLRTLGVPDSADKYELKPDQLPEGLKWDDALGEKWQGVFHELNIPATAGKQLMAKFIESKADEGKAVVEAEQARQAAIDKMFGQAKESTLLKIMNAAGVYGDDDTVEFMKTAPATVLQMMSKIAEQFDIAGDGQFNSRGERVMLSPNEAQAQLDEVNKKLFDETLSIQERDRLMKRSVELQSYVLGQKPDLSMFESAA